MRKSFLGIGFFAALFLIAAGFAASYLLGNQREQQKESIAAMETAGKVSISNHQSEENSSEKEQSGTEQGFLLKEEDGCVSVYREDGKEFYAKTAIQVRTLPESLQEELEKGIPLSSSGDLYSFLESYSS